MMRYILLALIYLLSTPAFGSSPRGGQYPSRSIELVVPFAPGGGTDNVARRLAFSLSKELGQSVVVVNRPGAATQIGSALVAKSSPDGYRLLLTAMPIATNPSLFKKLPYDAEHAFSPISLIARIPSVLVVNSHLPAKTIKELVDLSKSTSQGLNYASAGRGTAAHLAMELFKQKTGLKAIQIPYKGAGPQLAALVGGQADLGFVTISTALPQLASGNLRAIGIATARRSVHLPNVATLDELGLPGFEASAWFALMAPAGTPSSVISILNKAVATALNSPEVRKVFNAEGIESAGGSPAELATYLSSETKKWGEVIERAHIHLD